MSNASQEATTGDSLLVTVITPTYNQAQYIAACIDSVLGQSHRNIQYLIYDSCSSDGTESIVTPCQADPRVQYVRERDRGQSDAINKGFAQAKGDIVCWLNSDDFFYDSTVLDQVCRYFAANPGVDLITGDGYLAASDGTPVAPLIAVRDRINARGMAIADYFMQPSTFWRRNDLCLDQSLTFTFDWKFFVAMLRAGKVVRYMPAYLSVYRPHEASKTTQDTARRRWEVCHVLDFAGATLAQRVWCRTVYGLYALSEALHLPPLKTLARMANGVVRRLSLNHIFSC